MKFYSLSLWEIFCQELSGWLRETQVYAAEVVQTPNVGNKSSEFCLQILSIIWMYKITLNCETGI